MKVIIIGAGASGLMAANVLAKKDVEVIILESENRIGGRIHTLIPEDFTNHVEACAEFIHGNLPLTLQLMKKAGLPYVPAGEKMYRLVNGRLRSDFGRSKAWEMFYDKLAKLEKDCTLEAFLNEHFSAKPYEGLRKDVRDMAQGLDLADISRLSVLSIRDEWLSEEQQYRPLSGYQPLLEFLRNEMLGKPCKIQFGETVSMIKWRQGSVKAYTPKATYSADVVIMTASLGSLQKNQIAFEPPILQMQPLFKAIGFGEVIKMAFEFEQAFWEKEYPDMGFLFTEEGFTFWTQFPQHSPMLIGWIGNDYTARNDKFTDEELLNAGLQKLKKAFGFDVESLYKSGAVFRHTKNSNSHGGYSWLTLESKPAIRKINKGIDNTIWFAGEALHPGAEVGTVEAALQSGRYTARKILKM